MLADFFRQADMEPNSMNVDRLCSLHELKNREQLYAGIGLGNIVLGEADLNHLRAKKNSRNWSRYLKFFKRNNAQGEETGQPAAPAQIDRKKPLILNEETIGHFIIGDCCHPIPGDDVLGYIDSTGRITIHKRQCPVANKLKTASGSGILAAQWDTHKHLYFPATIRIEGIDHVGVLYQIAAILSQQLNVNMHKLTIESHDGIFQGEINLQVHDVEDVRIICRDLKKINEIKSVTRIS